MRLLCPGLPRFTAHGSLSACKRRYGCTGSCTGKSYVSSKPLAFEGPPSPEGPLKRRQLELRWEGSI
eukprot:2989768-Alexandrium_andersonii.AAC.1